MNDEQRIKEKYFSGNVYLKVQNEKQKKEILKILYNIKQYGDENKGPDLVSKTENKIYGIEYFEFDSVKNNKKGSKFRQQLGIIDNKVNTEIKTKDKVNNVSALELEQNLENYINNYKKIYNDHYSKISDYLEYLNADFPKIKKEIWFFIEDVTPFGNHYLNKNCEPVLFNPMLSKELIELYEQSSLLQGIIFTTNSFEDEEKIFVYFNNKKSITLLKNECMKEDVKSLLVQNPLCFTTLIKMNKNVKSDE